MCDFRGRSILCRFIKKKKKNKKKSLPTDPNFEDHAIGNTHFFLAWVVFQELYINDVYFPYKVPFTQNRYRKPEITIPNNLTRLEENQVSTNLRKWYKILNLACLSWSLTLCINFKLFSWGKLQLLNSNPRIDILSANQRTQFQNA